MLVDAGRVCDTAVGCLQAFQPLVAALLAGAAALTSALVLWKSARLTDRRERERLANEKRQLLIFVANLLSNEVQGVASKTASIQGTIRAIRAANKELSDKTSERCLLYLPNDVDDWEKIGLLPSNIQRDIFSFRRMLERHNSNMRPGHTFGSDNALEDALGLLGLIAIEGGKIGSALIVLAKAEA